MPTWLMVISIKKKKKKTIMPPRLLKVDYHVALFFFINLTYILGKILDQVLALYLVTKKLQKKQ